MAVATGMGAAWLAFDILVWIYGQAPRAVFAHLVAGTWGSPYGIGQVFYKTTTLLLTGAAVDVALKAGLFNAGAEGQLAVAALATAFVGGRLAPHTPAWIAAPLAIGAALGAGAAWALPPALLRVRFGAHEVISTIMMNRIADALVGGLLVHGLAIAGTTRTPDVVEGARLARLDRLGISSLHGSAVSVALVLAVASVAAVGTWLARTVAGRETILVGLGPEACAAERIAVGRRKATAFALSGALAGLAAVGPVLGYKGYDEGGLAAGAGFTGIAVALLGRGHPVGLALAALLLGTLEQGGLAINAYVPMDVTTVIDGVVVVAVAVSDAGARRRLRT